jgi:hypothetical protein
MSDRGSWADRTHRRQPFVALPGAACHRCGPLRIDRIPVDQVCLERGSRGETRRVFRCPYCRADVRNRVDVREAFRLFAAGVRFDRGQRRPPRHKPLTADDLLDFAREVYTAEDLAYRAMHDSAQV